MKKILSISLIIILAVGLGTLAFADGFGFGRGIGFNKAVQDRDRLNFNYSAPGHMAMGGFRGTGQGLYLRPDENPIEIYSDISGMTYGEIVDEIRDGKTLSEIAEEDGLLDELEAKILEDKKDRLNALVEDDRLTQEQADEILENIEDNVLEGRVPFSGFGMGLGHGYFFGGTMMFDENPIEIYSELSGIEVEDLLDELRDGKTLSEIAEEDGLFDELEAKILEEKKDVLDELVEEGRISQQLADEMLEHMEDNILQNDNRPFGEFGRPSGFRGCRRF